MTIRTSNSKTLKIIGILIPVFLIGFFLIFPVVSVLISGFIDETGFTFSYLKTILGNTYYYKLFGFTLGQALLSTILTLLIGIPIGYIFGRYTFPGKKILLVIFTVPFVLPTVLVGIGFLSIFGEDGIFGASVITIILAHAFYNIPLVIHYFSAYYQNFDRSLIDAAKTLGSKRWHLLFRVFLPLFLQPILTSGLLTFTFCFLSYGIVTILGANNQLRTIEVQIFAEYFKSGGNLASILSILQIFIIITVVLVYLFYMRKRSKHREQGRTATYPAERLNFRKMFKQPLAIFLAIIFLGGLVLELAPLISTILRSFWNPHTAEIVNNFRNLFLSEIVSTTHISIPKAILNTILFALGAACLASFLAIITIISLGNKRTRKSTISIEMLTYLPLAISSITISLGITQTFVGSEFFSNYPWVFIIISQGLLGYPFVTRALLNGLNTIDPHLLDSARTLGANRFYMFRKIYLPLLLRSFLAGFAFAFGLSIGEFTIANFFANNYPSVSTLTVVLYRLSGSKYFGEANAIGVLLLIVSYISFFILEGLGANKKLAKRV